MLSLGLLLSLAGVAMTLAFQVVLPPTAGQCDNFTISWGGGSPPYEVTLVPFYPVGSTYQDPATLVVIDDYTNETSWSQPLPFGNGSSLVVVVSDSTGFGSGATSNVYTVEESNVTSCFIPASALPPQNFTFGLQPYNFSQCQPVEFFFFPSSGQIDPPLTVSAVIPGGQSKGLPEATLFNTSMGSTYAGGIAWSMNWTANIPEGSEVAFLAGDQYSRASGGWSPSMFVQESTVSSCLSDSNATSTTTAAPTATSTSSSSSSSSSTGSRAGEIVGAIAAALLLGLLALYCVRQRNIRRRRRSMQERNLGLMAYPLVGFDRDEPPRGHFGSE